MLAILLFFISCSSVLFSQEASPPLDDPELNILFIHSYYQGSPWTDDFHEAAMEELGRDLGDFSFRVEYLDAKHSPGNNYEVFFAELIEEKYRNNTFDLVITSDDPAHNLIIQKKPSLLENVPYIFGGVNRYPQQGVPRKAGISGVTDEPSLKKTLELAIQLHPKNSRMIVISDDITQTGGILYEQTREIVQSLPQSVDFEFWNNMTFGEIEKRASSLDSFTTIFWIGMIRDESDVIPNVRAQVSFLDKTLQRPIYSCWSHSIGYGYVGGKIVDSARQGRIVGSLAVEVLKGAPVETLPVVRGESANFYTFDYDQLKKYNVKLSALPPGSRILNKPETDISLKREQFFLMLFIVPASILFSILLLLLLFRNRKVTARLRVSEERFNLAMDSADEGLFDWNLRTNEVYFSPGWKKMLGYAPPDIANTLKNWDAWMSADGPPETELIRQEVRKKNHDRFEYEMKMKHKSGTWIDVLSRARILYDEKESSLRVVGTHIDITQRKLTEQQLLQSQKMESLGRLAGGIAHDFNNMLSVILGFSDMLLFHRDRRCENMEEIEHIHEAAVKSAELTKQLLGYARQQTVLPITVDLNRNIADMLEMLKRLIGEDIRLSFFPEKDPWPIRIDPSQVDQILTNLCINARDAIDGNGTITIETRNIRLDAEYCRVHPEFQEGNYSVLTISDNGCGMETEMKEKIFDPFFTSKETGKGTGLGLSTTLGIVKQNGGFINVYSETGLGSTFKVFFPVSDEKDIPLKEPDVASVRKGSETILVVDDKLSILHLSKKVQDALDGSSSGQDRRNQDSVH